MSLSAHTNAPGVHTLHEARYARETGVFRDNSDGSYLPINNEYLEATIPTAISRKPEPRKGDRKTPMVYGRSIEKITDDQPFTLLEESYSHEGTILQLRKETEGYISSGEAPFSRYPIGKLDEENAVKEAQTKALNDLVSTKAELGVALAEVKRTVNMLSESAIRAGSFLLALKRGQLNRLPGLLGIDPRLLKSDRGRTQANMWLQMQYGWKPLANEVHNLGMLAGEAMAANFPFKGYGKGTIEGSWSYSNGENNWTEKAKSSVKANIYAKIANSHLRDLNELGLSNPAAIAWELVPWSFAIDWFMPVGNTLNAATAHYGLDFIKGWSSKQMTYSAECQKSLGPRSAWVDVIRPGSYREEGFFFFRDPYGGFPSAGFYADTTPFSTPRALNAIALLRQLAK